MGAQELSASGAGCRDAEAGEERRTGSPGPTAVGRREGRGSWRCLRAESAERKLSGLSHLGTGIEPGAPKKRSGQGHSVAVLALPMGYRTVCPRRLCAFIRQNV